MEHHPQQDTHPEAVVLGYCRHCGRAVPEGQGRQWQGSLHCMECVVELSQRTSSANLESESNPEGNRYPTSAPAPDREQRTAAVASDSERSPSPILALILGLIPGVGAVYNGQYAKAVLHVVLFGSLISLLPEGPQPIIALLVALMFFYMPIESFRTARAIERGDAVEEFSGLLPPGTSPGSSPVTGIGLIVVGVILLLQSLGLVPLRSLAPYWPVLLIAAGIYMLYRRVVESSEAGTLQATHAWEDRGTTIRSSDSAFSADVASEEDPENLAKDFPSSVRSASEDPSQQGGSG